MHDPVLLYWLSRISSFLYVYRVDPETMQVFDNEAKVKELYSEASNLIVWASTNMATASQTAKLENEDIPIFIGLLEKLLGQMGHCLDWINVKWSDFSF